MADATAKPGSLAGLVYRFRFARFAFISQGIENFRATEETRTGRRRHQQHGAGAGAAELPAAFCSNCVMCMSFRVYLFGDVLAEIS